MRHGVEDSSKSLWLTEADLSVGHPASRRGIPVQSVEV